MAAPKLSPTAQRQVLKTFHRRTPDELAAALQGPTRNVELSRSVHEVGATPL